MKRLFKVVALVLGNVWMAPNTGVSALYLGVLWAFGQVEFVRHTEWALLMRAMPGSWLGCSAMKEWAGWASGCFVIMRFDYAYDARTIRHEEQHVIQQMVFGAFQPVLYGLASVIVWCFMRRLHSYYDNPFERNARRAAGQQGNIPRELWDNPTDRWSWW